MDNHLFTDLALPSLAWQTVFRHLGWSLALAVVLAKLMPKRWARRWWWGLGLGVACNLPGVGEVTSALALSFHTPSLLSQTLLLTVLWHGLRGRATQALAPEHTPKSPPRGPGPYWHCWVGCCCSTPWAGVAPLFTPGVLAQQCRWPCCWAVPQAWPGPLGTLKLSTHCTGCGAWPRPWVCLCSPVRRVATLGTPSATLGYG